MLDRPNPLGGRLDQAEGPMLDEDAQSLVGRWSMPIRHGLTIGELAAQLAEALGVSRQTINSIETGKYDPSLPLAIAIARHFATTVEEIFHVDA